MNRTAAREMAFKLIYSLEVQKPNAEELKEETELFLENNEISEKKVKEYVEDVINGIKEHEEEIVTLISSNLKEGWEIARVSKINVAILKLNLG